MPKKTNYRASRRLSGQLKNLSSLIREAAPKKPRKWYEKFYEKITFVAKYIGIPGIIIAAVGPIQKLSEEWIEHHNKVYIQTTYLNYVKALLDQGSIDRANKLLITLEGQKDFDSRLQYYKAKVLIAMAIQQARNYSEAYDTAKILTSIQESKDIFFPGMGGVDELIELKMALVDIDTAQQQYQPARNALQLMKDQKTLQTSRLLASNIEYRYGVLDVLQFNLPSAQSHLLSARQDAQTTNQKLLAANSAFQLAKAYQFAGDHPAALKLYETVEQEFAGVGDQFGMLRAYNNMAMIYFDRQEYETARKYYNMEQVLARQLGDELGYARATMNIALIEKNQGNYDASIRMALDALGAFRQQNALNGMHGASILLSNDYFHLGNLPDALTYAKQAFSSAMQQRDLRAVTAACGSLANVYDKLRDSNETIYSSLCAMTLIKHLAYQKLPKSEFDYQYFKASIAKVKTTVAASAYQSFLDSSAKRVGDILIELNLEKNLLDAEVNSLRQS
jgi:tetratricopeptide (TPR) repeat protein